VDSVTVIYRGPPAQQVTLLAQHGHPATCEPGRSYELPADAAERLVRSSAWFRYAPAPKPAPESTSRRRSRKTPVMEPAAEPAAAEAETEPEAEAPAVDQPAPEEDQ
jgi:hypothetical protein